MRSGKYSTILDRRSFHSFHGFGTGEDGWKRLNIKLLTNVEPCSVTGSVPSRL